MSHLILKRVDGKWKAYNKNTGKTEGKGMVNKDQAEEEIEIQDEKEDKVIEKGMKQEAKEHPKFSHAMAKQIAVDHLKEKPTYYGKKSK